MEKSYNIKAWKIILAIIYLILCFTGFAKGFYTGIAVLLIFVPLPIMLFSVFNSVRNKSREGLLSIPAWILSLTIALGIMVFSHDDIHEDEKMHNADNMSAETVVTDSDDNVTNEDDIVYITSSGSKYHNKSCTSMKSEGIEITVGEAVSDGYEPCKNCIKQ